MPDPPSLAPYLEAVRLVGEAQRQLYDLLEDELGRRGHYTVTPQQAILLWKLGDATLPFRILAAQCYLGRNPHHMVKHLASVGFLERQTDKNDRREAFYKLTTAGREIRDVVDDIYACHAAALEGVASIAPDALAGMNAMLRRLEGFWAHQLRYRA